MSAFITSEYKAGCQSWKVLAFENNPRTQNDGCALAGGQRETEFIHFAESVVAAMVCLFGGGSGLLEGVAQQIRVGQSNAKDSPEYARFVLAVAMKRVEGVILEFRAEVRALAVGKLHEKDAVRGRLQSIKNLVLNIPSHALL